ncbi:Sphingomyelin phosphodiesterase 2 [Exophiala dermatitidis]|uniref:Sphingomyelin phosphodiesterase n=1 Tax=Exophiala dermatitidis (strain ATCC 34100 / CBS 525.76 / NIH/UT8656) TaxID=858893 RepID=H6C2A6_EXODN|nr:sphingomyelin phosphodiesterase [Exophiala dermatitidis NIH/UT8656]EHY57878.1 sphingomyelin phosphodiesterase [Exophiala dermatitidis NIH/UT8656]
MALAKFAALLRSWAFLGHILLLAVAFAAGSIGSQSPLVGQSKALDPKLTNTIAKDVITLYYNGTGPVPDRDQKPPDPESITPLAQSLIEDSLVNELVSIATTGAYADDCSKCIAATQILHVAAISHPVSLMTNVLIRTCNALPFVQDKMRASSCESEFGGVASFGPYIAQLLSKMSMATGDMYSLCSLHFDYCPEEAPILIDESLFFDPKPESAEIAPEPSGETFNVLHLSDWHLDPRYDIASEGNCSEYLCCRTSSRNDELFTDSHNASVPASRFGSYLCDAPADLALSALKDMPEFFDLEDIAFSIFTGDVVSHDPEDELSHAYVSYEEEVAYRVFKKMLGDDMPIYPVLGNHETLPVGFNTPHSMNPDPHNTSSNILQWNYDLVSSLWSKHSWLNDTEADFARTHYGAYATTTAQGLRIIALNSDFWYRDNIFAFFNVTNPDPSGILKWLADELSACEKRGQRAWIIAHVLTGYDGNAPIPTPTALFYSIVRRFSPATIAVIFLGHTHQDQLEIFYDYLPESLKRPSSDMRTHGHHLRDTMEVDFTKPLQVAYIGPSITPLTGLNSGYRVYQIDSKTFSVMGAQTYFANISNSLHWTKPEWEFEYDTREAYSVKPHSKHGSTEEDDDSTNAEVEVSKKKKQKPGVPWPSNAPLNATFWHLVTEKMLKDSGIDAMSMSPGSKKSGKSSPLLDLYNTYESKSSTSPFRRGAGAISPEQKVCYMRAGSGGLGSRCKEKYGDSRGVREKVFGIV